MSLNESSHPVTTALCLFSPVESPLSLLAKDTEIAEKADISIEDIIAEQIDPKLNQKPDFETVIIDSQSSCSKCSMDNVDLTKSFRQIIADDESKVNVIDWTSQSELDRVKQKRNEQKFSKYANAVDQLEKSVQKGDVSKHNKVYDSKKGKFVDAAKATNPINITRDSSLFVHNGNALGRAEAEIDLLLYEAENKTNKTTNSSERNSINKQLAKDTEALKKKPKTVKDLAKVEIIERKNMKTRLLPKSNEIQEQQEEEESENESEQEDLFSEIIKDRKKHKSQVVVTEHTKQRFRHHQPAAIYNQQNSESLASLPVINSAQQEMMLQVMYGMDLLASRPVHGSKQSLAAMFEVTPEHSSNSESLIMSEDSVSQGEEVQECGFDIRISVEETDQNEQVCETIQDIIAKQISYDIIEHEESEDNQKELQLQIPSGTRTSALISIQSSPRQELKFGAAARENPKQVNESDGEVSDEIQEVTERSHTDCTEVEKTANTEAIVIDSEEQVLDNAHHDIVQPIPKKLPNDKVALLSPHYKKKDEIVHSSPMNGGQSLTIDTPTGDMQEVAQKEDCQPVIVIGSAILTPLNSTKKMPGIKKQALMCSSPLAIQELANNSPILIESDPNSQEKAKDIKPELLHAKEIMLLLDRREIDTIRDTYQISRRNVKRLRQFFRRKSNEAAVVEMCQFQTVPLFMKSCPIEHIADVLLNLSNNHYKVVGASSNQDACKVEKHSVNYQLSQSSQIKFQPQIKKQLLLDDDEEISIGDQDAIVYDLISD